jgi:DNA modification methylase
MNNDRRVIEMNNSRYRVIEVKAQRTIENNDIEFIKELSYKFPKEDCYFEHKKNKIIANIKELDLAKFKNIVQQLTKKYHLQKRRNPFQQLVEEIERIGSYGIKGRKRIFVDFNKERKVIDRKSKEERRGIYFYAQGHPYKKKNNEVPEEFVNQIICGDSEVILKKLPENCVDLIFTSPPYNFGLNYDATEDGIDWNKYFDKLFRVFKECIRTLKYGGRIIVDIQPLFSDYIPSHHIISKFFMEHKLIWKGEILWEKHNYNCKYTAWGSWKSPSNPYLKYTWEFLEIFCKGTMKKEGKRENIDITADEFKKWVVSKWDIAPERNMKKYGHPAMFPEELVYRVVKLFSYKNDFVLDPFNGVGTTTAVARRLGRRYLGIDISEDYHQKAIQRIKETLF